MGGGLFISFEGIDSSGKRTQANLLAQRLEELGHDVILMSFPVYESPFGQLVGKFLRGEFGPREELSKEVITLLYSIDRYQFKEEIASFLEDGGILICDRYSQSNHAYQVAELPENGREEFLRWMEVVESRLPSPDIIFFIDTPPFMARSLMEQKSLRKYLGGEKMDQNERAFEFQKKVHRAYQFLVERGPKYNQTWISISSIEDGRLRTKEDIHEDVWSQLHHLIPRKKNI